jgi:hypothetical protein
MPKKRRNAHVPQQAARRRRAAARRDFAPAPDPPLESEPRADLDGNPIYASETADWSSATAGYSPTGPVETRPHWIGTQTARREGRRRAELRGGAAGQVRVTPGQLPTYERAYLVNELQRIGIISGSLLAVIIVLAIVLR